MRDLNELHTAVEGEQCTVTICEIVNTVHESTSTEVAYMGIMCLFLYLVVMAGFMYLDR